MTRVLNAERRAPLSGDTRSVVVFLHGYGANGADLLGLADPLAEHLPDTLFVAPDAPESCAGAPFGFQWFPIPWIDGSSEEEAARGMQAAASDLDAFLDAILVDEDLLPEQMVLFGFSQGTMMALHVAPRREDPVAGVVAFSGRLLQPEVLPDEVVSRMPVLLVHGDADDVVPVQSLANAAEGLQDAGFKEVFAHVMKGTAHGIAPDGLSISLAFMRDKLSL
ncbi:MAG: alpha/beta hydrolase [Rhodobacterales bacterium]